MRDDVVTRTRVLLAATAVVSMTAAARAASQDILGFWERGDGNARVQIAPCGNALCAINTWIGDESGGEHVGDRLLMKVSGDGSFLSGTAYDPQRQLTYNLEINLKPQSMQTRGCVLAGIICKSVNWSRVSR